jgi:hypothetical protein
MGKISSPAILTAVDWFLLIAAIRRNIDPINSTVVKVKRRKMKNAPGSRFRLARKYNSASNIETLISLIGHVEAKDDIASIPG